MGNREEKRNLETIPVGSLGIIAMEGCKPLGEKVDQYLVKWRAERESEHKDSLAFSGYQRNSYLLGAKVPRFGSGEAKGVILESVRGTDLYLLVDVCNYSLTYSLCGHENHMSPDDHYQDLKRLIAAVGGKARRITVIMPYLLLFCTDSNSHQILLFQGRIYSEYPLVFYRHVFHTLKIPDKIYNFHTHCFWAWDYPTIWDQNMVFSPL